MPAAALRCSRDLRFVWVSQQCEAGRGEAAEGSAGSPMADLLGAPAMRELQRHIERVLCGEQVQHERLADFKGLRRRWVRSVYTPTFDAAGAVDGWVAVAFDIHDRKLAEEALKEADRRKDEFLAVLAHELRNPLAPIRNAAAILGRKGSQDPEVAWSQGVIERQLEQLSRLIDDLVDIERIARGRFVLRKDHVPLETVIDMALESTRPVVNAAGHHLSVLLPSERAVIAADPARLAQVVATLLQNAARPSRLRGSIGLTASIEGAEVAVTVEDSGVGLEPEVAARLFDAGSRSRAGEDTTRPGIGLTLARGIVALHGGRIEAKSRAEGQGAEFVVRL